MKTKKLFLKGVVLSLYLLVIVNIKVLGSHLSGEDMTYECLSSCKYRVYHYYYLDCTGAANYVYPNIPSSPILGFSGSPSNCQPSQPIGNWTYIGTEEVTPVCPSYTTGCSVPGSPIWGLVGLGFYLDLDLCGSTCSSYTISSQNCCMNYALTSGAQGNGLYSSITIDLTLTPCNSAPKFKNPPSVYLCTGSLESISQSAYDIDGDSLSYSLGPCYVNANQTVNYSTGYSPTSPLGSGWLVSIDPVTGELTCTPNPTGGYSSGIVCVNVTEWRNGFQIGQISRPFVYTAINCGGPTQPNAYPEDTLQIIQGGLLINRDKIEVNAGDFLLFDLIFTDPDTTQNLDYVINPLPPNAFLNPNPNGDSLTLNFYWQTTLADTGNYYLWIQAFDDTCLINNHTNRFIEIVVVDPVLVASITHTPCGMANGSINLTTQFGAQPYTYVWNTGALTEDISGLLAGTYTVTVTDVNGIIRTKSFHVDNLNAFTVNAVSSNFVCLQNSGSISLNILGGTAPYQYNWSNGATTPAITNLPPGGYSVTITDASNCMQHLVYTFSPPCHSTISGVLFSDVNANCIQDQGEKGIPYGLMKVAGGPLFMSDSLGFYTCNLDTGSFDIYYYPLLPAYMTTPCPGINPITVTVPQLGMVIPGQNTPVEIDSVTDYSVYLYESHYKPGNTHYTCITYGNSALDPGVGAQLVYQHSDQAHSPVFSVTPSFYNPVNRTAVWDFPSGINFSGVFQMIDITFQVDTLAVLGDTAYSEVMLYPIISDVNPVNNHDSVTKVVVSAFDPNDKQVFPEGLTAQGYIPYNTPTLEYTIRFQNTGTWYAEHVIIKDKLDPNLDVNTLEYRGSSHNCSIMIDENDTLVITFADIHLPDSGRDMKASQGFICLGIKPKSGLAPETTVSNWAGIYFDFNAPIITNTVNSTFHVAPNIVLPDTICQGQAAAATVLNGVPPYLWNNSIQDTVGEFIFTPDSSGLFFLHLMDGFGASSVSYFVIPPPGNAGFNYFYNGNSFSFTPEDTTYSSYFWDFGNETTSTLMNPTVLYSQSGNYLVTLTVSNQCGSFTDTMTVSVTTGLEGTAFAQSVRLYPNPASQTALLTFDNPKKSEYTLIIRDITGRLISSQIQSGNEFQIETGKLASGVYTWELRGEKVATGRFTVGE